MTDNRVRWPSDHADWIYLQRAMQEVGRTLYPIDWDGREPRTVRPALPPYEAASASVRAEVAMSLERTREHFRTGESYSYRAGMEVPELTLEEWAAAKTARQTANEGAVASRKRWLRAVEAIEKALRRGDIESGILSSSHGGIIPVRDLADFWHVPQDIFAKRLAGEKARIATSWANTTEGPIFLSKASFASFLRSIDPNPLGDAPIRFDLGAEHFSLFEALVWAATGGAETSTRQVVEHDLMVVGARTLFPRLARQELQVEGLNADLTFEPITAGLWEMAILEPGEGHLVTVYQGPAGIEADMTPFRKTQPAWRRLRIRREHLVEAFPRKEPSRAPSVSSWQPQIIEMIGLMDKNPKMAAKTAARKVTSPERFQALYKAFRKQHPDKLRSYFSD